MDPFLTLIEKSEDWLMDRVLAYAKKTGYVKYTSTLKEAWRLSIEGLSKPLMASLRDFTMIPDLHPEDDYLQNPIAAFGIYEARLHRTRGISLIMFLGLMKYYRASYLDLIETGEFDPGQIHHYRLFTMRFFDLVELGFISEWSTFSENDQMHELQQSNRLMTNEKNRFLTIFESLANPVILSDEHHRIINMNLAASQLLRLQYSSGDLYYGDHPSHSLPQWLKETLHQHAREQDVFQTFEKMVVTSKGAEVYLQIFCHKMLDVSEKFKGTILIIHDITTLRKLIQQLSQANTTKDKFFSIISHDLITPFSSILGFANLLANEWDEYNDEQRKQLASKIKTTSENAFNLLKNILDWAQSQQGNIEARRSQIVVKPIVDEVVQLLFPSAYKKSITLSHHLSDSLTVFGDVNMFRTVLRNIIANAIKFTPHHGEITIVAYPENALMVFEIRDTGIGIDQPTLEKLFRLDESTQRPGTDNEKGTGLGLLLCKELVEKNMGNLFVDSKPGEGSTFRFTLPIA